MLIKILYFIFVVALLRFLLITMKTIFSMARPRKKTSPSRPASDDPTAGQRVVDVEFTEKTAAKEDSR